MNEHERKGFQNLELDAKVTLIGQLLLTTGTAFLSLGQIFKLLKEDRLTTEPVSRKEQVTTDKTVSLYGGRRSYFES